MITFIAADIGAGKTCYAAKLARQAIKKGRPVYSNTYIKGARKIKASNLEKFKCPKGSLIILDETGNEFNARNFAKIQMAIIEYFKLSRHWGNDLILISQTFGDTDKQIRELAGRVLFIRPLIHGILSMVVRVNGHLGVGQDGQPAKQYKIGRIGAIYFLPLYFKYFNSFEAPDRQDVNLEYWGSESPGQKDSQCATGALALLEQFKQNSNPVIEDIQDTEKTS